MKQHLNLKSITKAIILFIIGGIVYCAMEILWRGYTHWTMGILGGLCFIIIGEFNEHIEWDEPLWIQMIKGSFVITSLEFITGCILNLWLHLNIWDYSNLPMNILGQICVPFMVIWFFVSLIAIVLDDFIRWKLFDEEKPHYKLF